MLIKFIQNSDQAYRFVFSVFSNVVNPKEGILLHLSHFLGTRDPKYKGGDCGLTFPMTLRASILNAPF